MAKDCAVVGEFLDLVVVTVQFQFGVGEFVGCVNVVVTGLALNALCDFVVVWE